MDCLGKVCNWLTHISVSTMGRYRLFEKNPPWMSPKGFKYVFKEQVVIVCFLGLRLALPSVMSFGAGLLCMPAHVLRVGARQSTTVDRSQIGVVAQIKTDRSARQEVNVGTLFSNERFRFDSALRCRQRHTDTCRNPGSVPGFANLLESNTIGQIQSIHHITCRYLLDIIKIARVGPNCGRIKREGRHVAVQIA